MDVRLTVVNDGFLEYEITDERGKVYGVHDELDDNGIVIDTHVIDAAAYCEVEDSELFKKLVTLRTVYKNSTEKTYL